VRVAAAGALGKFAEDEVAFGALFHRYESEERDDVRAECVRQLGAVGVGDIAAALEKLADNERFHPELRGAALTGLAGQNLFDKADAPARARLVARAARLAAAAASRELRKPAIETLGLLAKRSDATGDAAADALVGLLQDPSLWVKATALEALEEAASPRTLAGLLRFHESAAFPDQKSHARRIIAAVVAALPP
jgi:HEAT repeat protein